MGRDVPQTHTRIAARLATGFALDLVKLGGLGRDVVDGLLVCAISQANVSQITRNPELQRAYATVDQPPPDELRRPVSVSAIANSLRLPFETTRRRISGLAAAGYVVSTSRGVIVPTAPLSSPFYGIVAGAHYNLVRNLYLRLRQAGLLEDLPRPANPAFDPQNPPVRLVVRLSTDYVLRLADPIGAEIGDLVSGLVLMDLFHANTEHLPDTVAGPNPEDWTPEGFVSDELRRPVRPVQLAQRLGIAHETVRRHLFRLVEADRCERNEDGYLVPTRVLARPEVVQFMQDNQSHLLRLCGQLADFGVLAEWEREILALRGAA